MATVKPGRAWTTGASAPVAGPDLHAVAAHAVAASVRTAQARSVPQSSRRNRLDCGTLRGGDRATEPTRSVGSVVLPSNLKPDARDPRAVVEAGRDLERGVEPAARGL